MRDVYLRLAKHLQDLIMGYPYNEALTDLIKETYSPVEAQVALAIPNNLAPLEVVSLETIAAGCDLHQTPHGKPRPRIFCRFAPPHKTGERSR
jgi:hypothetical protein